MRLLVVHAHPAPESYGSALFRAVVEAAKEGGHEVRALDLHAEGFDPVMGAEEWRGYYRGEPEDPLLRRHADALRWAEGLVLVFPIWWGTVPAILKGWFDRVWREGVAYRTEGRHMRPGLPQMRLIGVVTTMGASRLQWELLGAPGRRMLLRGLKVCTGWRSRTFWLALHDMDRSTPARRERFLARARARIARAPL
jgi:NAD(P)H dehydrogenase (quinone)